MPHAPAHKPTEDDKSRFQSIDEELLDILSDREPHDRADLTVQLRGAVVHSAKARLEASRGCKIKVDRGEKKGQTFYQLVWMPGDPPLEEDVAAQERMGWWDGDEDNLVNEAKPMVTAAVESDACPKCGVTDLDAPCLGSPEHGSKPLPYRHAGRAPPVGQLRLNCLEGS